MSQKRRPRPAAPTLDIRSVVAAFSEEQIERMVGLSKRRLRYWAKTGFFAPSFIEEDGRLPNSRFYSFKDIVALRTLELLRVKNRVPLQHLRRVAERLSHLRDDLWTKTTLFVADRKVVFVNPETGKPQEIVSGQYLLELPLSQVMNETSATIIAFQRRPEQTVGQVSQSRAVIRNAPVIAGTRIPVGAVVRLSEDGYSTDQIIREYPDLTTADVAAALKFRAKAVA